jgi:hypothetical protein
MNLSSVISRPCFSAALGLTRTLGYQFPVLGHGFRERVGLEG